MTKPLILVTNDDGIASPGLAAAAAALDPLGELLIAAPASQQTSMGRSRTRVFNLDGAIRPHSVSYQGQAWDGFSVSATPALTVEHAIQELARRPIDLVVSGINYGENIGTCITVSGTIGAAMEAAERGLKAIAVSLETDAARWFEHDQSVDFGTAMHFVRLFAVRALENKWPLDVDVLKVEIPISATPKSGWMVTRQDKISYYTPTLAKRENIFADPSNLEHLVAKGQYSQTDTDAYAMAKGLVSVTPLSLDHTSRVELAEIQKLIG
ncbi:MAG: 5'/3'-nucleotidase SurE [Chloroflexi bacterium]|nr:MAG: 5'/3'-nucleotidase SurE [Chloroflexota bacterium]